MNAHKTFRTLNAQETVDHLWSQITLQGENKSITITKERIVLTRTTVIQEIAQTVQLVPAIRRHFGEVFLIPCGK